MFCHLIRHKRFSPLFRPFTIVLEPSSCPALSMYFENFVEIGVIYKCSKKYLMISSRYCQVFSTFWILIGNIIIIIILLLYYYYYYFTIIILLLLLLFYITIYNTYIYIYIYIMYIYITPHIFVNIFFPWWSAIIPTLGTLILLYTYIILLAANEKNGIERWC